jgi:formylglycine-generating enzyme required for sulfatase activity
MGKSDLQQRAILGSTSAVGIFPRSASPFGLDDMAGNVWEWCSDEVDLPWDKDACGRVHRGGGWASNARFCRSAYRRRREPAYRYDFLGFRVAPVPLGG